MLISFQFDTSYFKRAQNFNKKSFLKGKLKEFINYSYDYGSYMVLTGWINKNHHQFDEIITCWYKLSTYLTYTETASKTIAWEHIDHRIGGILYFNLLRKRYKKLKGIISLTGESKKFYEKIHNKVFKISNIVGDQYENFEYDKSKKDNIILLASRLDPEKNVKEFIDIISEVNFPNDWKVIIAGTGFIACEVENHAKKRCAITFNS